MVVERETSAGKVISRVVKTKITAMRKVRYEWASLRLQRTLRGFVVRAVMGRRGNMARRIQRAVREGSEQVSEPGEEDENTEPLRN